jgi:hypothetical protein
LTLVLVSRAASIAESLANQMRGDDAVPPAEATPPAMITADPTTVTVQIAVKEGDGPGHYRYAVCKGQLRPHGGPNRWKDQEEALGDLRCMTEDRLCNVEILAESRVPTAVVKELATKMRRLQPRAGEDGPEIRTITFGVLDEAHR